MRPICMEIQENCGLELRARSYVTGQRRDLRRPGATHENCFYLNRLLVQSFSLPRPSSPGRDNRQGYALWIPEL